VFENRVLKRIFGKKKDEIIRGWRKLRNEELYNMYSSPNIIRMIESRIMKTAAHAERMWEKDECIEGFGRKARRKENARKI
jgi:hypothetical protein